MKPRVEITRLAAPIYTPLPPTTEKAYGTDPKLHRRCGVSPSTTWLARDP